MIISIFVNRFENDTSIPRCALYSVENATPEGVQRATERISAFNEIYGNPQIKL